MTRIDFADGGHNYFAYDADSKRVSKQDSEGYAEFIYQGPDMLKLLMERDDEGETQAHYTMGQGLEAMRRANGDGMASGNSSFYHYNHLGTTHELTDADEDVTDTYRYDAWGVELARTGTTVNPHTYVGRERYYCMVSGKPYLLGLRYYVPRVGSFMTIDPDKRQGPGSRFYIYVTHNPVVLVDPEGTHEPVPNKEFYSRTCGWVRPFGKISLGSKEWKEAMAGWCMATSLGAMKPPTWLPYPIVDMWVSDMQLCSGIIKWQGLSPPQRHIFINDRLFCWWGTAEGRHRAIDLGIVIVHEQTHAADHGLSEEEVVARVHAIVDRNRERAASDTFHPPICIEGPHGKMVLVKNRLELIAVEECGIALPTPGP